MLTLHRKANEHVFLTMDGQIIAAVHKSPDGKLCFDAIEGVGISREELVIGEKDYEKARALIRNRIHETGL